jgi:hypothetical protein
VGRAFAWRLNPLAYLCEKHEKRGNFQKMPKGQKNRGIRRV